MSTSGSSEASDVTDPRPAEAPLRILHIMRAPVGGLFRHVYDLALAQAERGHFVGIIADRTAADSLTQARLATLAPKLKLGLSLIPMSRQPGLGDVSAIRSITKIARALDLDVLHGHGAKGGAYARFARKRLSLAGERARVFHTPHGGTLHYKPGTTAGTAFFVLERIMGRMTDGLIFESDYARRAYGRLIGESGPPRRVIPNGLGPADFEQMPPNPDAANFLFIGELRALKGVDILLEALARLIATHPVRAVIVGAGPDGDDFKQQARALNLEAHVTFPGAMPARAAFPLGHCLVVPSRAESFPYVVLEAGAAGKPVIATDVGGIPEIVAGTSTRLVAPGSVEDLLRAMTEVLAEPDAALQRAQELRDNVARKFTVAAMADAVLAFYRAPVPA